MDPPRAGGRFRRRRGGGRWLRRPTLVREVPKQGGGNNPRSLQLLALPGQAPRPNPRQAHDPSKPSSFPSLLCVVQELEVLIGFLTRISYKLLVGINEILIAY